MDYGDFSKKNFEKLYIIGDIHGDFEVLLICLIELAKVVNPHSGDWINSKNNILVVFLGDIMDRARTDKFVSNDENSDIDIFLYLNYLDKQARKYNSRVILTIGNHDIYKFLGQKTKDSKNIINNFLKISKNHMINYNLNQILESVNIYDVYNSPENKKNKYPSI